MYAMHSIFSSIKLRIIGSLEGMYYDPSIYPFIDCSIRLVNSLDAYVGMSGRGGLDEL